MTVETLTPVAATDLPQYEAPAIRVMSEEEILKSFQITQAMGTWWGGVTSPCTC